MEKTDLFVHLTPSIENLQGILTEGFKLHFCEKFVQYQKKQENDDEEYYSWSIYPIISFCNIKLSQITQHTRNYGNYGIIMSAHWAKRVKLNPIIYFDIASKIGVIMGKIAMDGGHTVDTSYETLNGSLAIIPYLKNNYGRGINEKIDKKFGSR